MGAGEITSRLSADTTTVSDQICLNLNVGLRSLTQAAMVLAFMFQGQLAPYYHHLHPYSHDHPRLQGLWGLLQVGQRTFSPHLQCCVRHCEVLIWGWRLCLGESRVLCAMHSFSRVLHNDGPNAHLWPTAWHASTSCYKEGRYSNGRPAKPLHGGLQGAGEGGAETSWRRRTRWRRRCCRPWPQCGRTLQKTLLGPPTSTACTSSTGSV